LTTRLGIYIHYTSRTTGGFKGREGLAPVCHSCDKKLGVGGTAEIQAGIPSDVMPLVFSAQLASEELGVKFELIDTNRLNLVQQMKERFNGKPIPRVSVGQEYITGFLTKDEIIDCYNQVGKIPR